MLLDTGSDISFLTLAAARQMKLRVHRYGHLGVYDESESASLEGTSAKELRIGDVTLKDHSINVAGLEIQGGNGAASFLLGADFLSHFAAEYDFAHGVVRLLRPHDCKLEQLAYWAPEFSKANLVRYSFDEPKFIVRINVNGKAQMARLESGSPRSLITLDAASAAGISPSSPDVKQAEPETGHPGQASPPSWTAPFDSVEVGAEFIRNAHLRMISDLPDAPSPGYPRHQVGQTDYGVILGSDFFLAHRIVIIPEENAVLFTYNGGKVF
jgi:hypothetical protein